jgi:hypothetical protein
MATTTINREPFKVTNEWEIFEDGTVSLSFGNKRNNLTFKTFGSSNITISSKFKSEKSAISVKRDAISSVEVNTKTYPIWITLALLIFLYSAIMVFPEMEKFDQCTTSNDPTDPDMNLYYDCDYIPFGTQFGGFIGILLCILAYIITKRGRIILRVQSDADFRILVSSQAMPSARQMRELVNAIMFIPNPNSPQSSISNPDKASNSTLHHPSQPVQQQPSNVHANVNTIQHQRSELPPPAPPQRLQ